MARHRLSPRQDRKLWGPPASSTGATSHIVRHFSPDTGTSVTPCQVRGQMDRVVRSPVRPTLYICLVATHLLYSNEKSYRELHVVETEERNVLCKYCEYKEKQGDLADVLAGDSHSRMCLVLLWPGRDTGTHPVNYSYKFLLLSIVLCFKRKSRNSVKYHWSLVPLFKVEIKRKEKYVIQK